MEYIKQLFISNSMLGYGVGVIVLVLILGIAFFFIRRKNLNDQNNTAIYPNNTGGVMMAQANGQINGVNDTLMQGGIATSLSKDPRLNTFMNSEELVNNSFVASAEENAAKRATDNTI